MPAGLQRRLTEIYDDQAWRSPHLDPSLSVPLRISLQMWADLSRVPVDQEGLLSGRRMAMAWLPSLSMMTSM
jgi:hypothetical protein